jgi:hypothetical protein
MQILKALILLPARIGMPVALNLSAAASYHDKHHAAWLRFTCSGPLNLRCFY